jgi:hypothetical protein
MGGRLIRRGGCLGNGDALHVVVCLLEAAADSAVVLAIDRECFADHRVQQRVEREQCSIFLLLSAVKR